MIIATVEDAKDALADLTPAQKDSVAKLIEMALDSEFGGPLYWDELTEVAEWLRNA